jgi:glyoxylase-like metal-dependent hydrolase (beta-lactamase superfamily II)
MAAIMILGYLPLPAAAQPATGNVAVEGIEILPLRDNFYVIGGAGANVAVQIGADGVVVVNAGRAEMSNQLMQAIRQLAPNKGVIDIIDTSAAPDETQGNSQLKALHPRGWPDATIIASQDAMNQMIAAQEPESGWPSSTLLLEDQKGIYANGEGIEILKAPAGHSSGDVMVYFRRSDVLVGGDAIDTEHFPFIDLKNGGAIQGELDALNRIIGIAIPSVPDIFQPGGTWVVPAHGRVFEQADVVHYRDMLTIIRDHVQALIAQGDTLQQVEAADPALGYAGEYGASSGAWTTADFVAAVYESLKKQPQYAAAESDTGVKLK